MSRKCISCGTGVGHKVKPGKVDPYVCRPCEDVEDYLETYWMDSS